MITREELLELIPPFDVRWRMEVVDAIWPIIKKLQQELACDVCAGTGNPPAEICACRGTNNIHEVLLTVRQEYVRLQQENTEWAAVHEGRVKQIRELARDAQKAEQENADLHTLLTDIHDGLDSIAHGATNGKPWAAKMAQRIADKLEKKDG